MSWFNNANERNEYVRWAFVVLTYTVIVLFYDFRASRALIGALTRRIYLTVNCVKFAAFVMGELFNEPPDIPKQELLY